VHRARQQHGRRVRQPRLLHCRRSPGSAQRAAAGDPGAAALAVRGTEALRRASAGRRRGLPAVLAEHADRGPDRADQLPRARPLSVRQRTQGRAGAVHCRPQEHRGHPQPHRPGEVRRADLRRSEHLSRGSGYVSVQAAAGEGPAAGTSTLVRPTPSVPGAAIIVAAVAWLGSAAITRLWPNATEDWYYTEELFYLKA